MLFLFSFVSSSPFLPCCQLTQSGQAAGGTAGRGQGRGPGGVGVREHDTASSASVRGSGGGAYEAGIGPARACLRGSAPEHLNGREKQTETEKTDETRLTGRPTVAYENFSGCFGVAAAPAGCCGSEKRLPAFIGTVITVHPFPLCVRARASQAGISQA